MKDSYLGRDVRTSADGIADLQRRLVSLLLRRFMNAEYFEKQRRDMLAAIRAISAHMAAEAGKTALDERVLRAMAKVPRHEFVPFEVQEYAYLNRPIPIGFDKTISQPLMVASWPAGCTASKSSTSSRNGQYSG
jgi:hypothetical protein